MREKFIIFFLKVKNGKKKIVLCSHAELPITVIYVLGEFTSPILLRSFISMEG